MLRCCEEGDSESGEMRMGGGVSLGSLGVGVLNAGRWGVGMAHAVRACHSESTREACFGMSCGPGGLWLSTAAHLESP